MDVFELSATLTLDSQDYDSGLSKAKNETSRFGDVLKANLASQAIQAGIKGVAKGFELIASVTKQAVSSYGQYEQLVGGIETLYKTSADTVLKYADNAYKTAGMSANQYMETATGFAASLVQALGGDTAKAAEYANTAITDMADNANKMGTDMGALQYAYQGFAKQNFTMLDNLKLGYGGTKAEMERLLEDAEKIKAAQGEVADYSIDSYADIVEAIHTVQTEMGITGTTAAEASGTIQGSLASAKSAWDNLLTGLANGNADIGPLFDNFFNAVVTAAGNIIPAVETALANIGRLIVEHGPELAQKGVDMIVHLGQGIAQGIPNVIAKLPEIIVGIVNFITSNLPAIVQTGVQIIVAIAKGLAQALPQLIAAAPQILAALAQGIVASLQILVSSGPEIIQAIGQGILNGLSALGDIGVQIVQAIAEGILRALGFLGDAIIAVFDGALSEGDRKAGEYRSLGEHAATETSDGYRDNSFSLYQAVTDSLNTANEGGRQAATRGTVTGEVLSTSTANGITANSGKVSGAATSAVSGAISAGRAAGAGASSIGVAISNGIASGIMSAASRIASSAASVVSQALAAAKAAAAIASPSKKFRDEVGYFMGLGVAKGLEKSEDKAIQAAVKLAQDTYQEAQEWLRRNAKFNEWTLQEQLEVWQEIQAGFVQGSQQYLDAEEKIFDLRREIEDEYFDDAKRRIQRDTKFKKLSLKEQLKLWADLQSQYEAGTAQFEELEEKTFDIREDIQDKFRDNVERIWQKIADAQEKYADKLQSRKEQIAASYGLFDDVQDRTRLNSQEILDNLTRQVNVMASFYDELDELAARGATEQMVQEIREMGPKAVDQLDALLAMTDKQFAKYAELYGKKQSLANDTALKELHQLGIDTGFEIKDQLAELNKLYAESSPTLGKTFVTEIANGIKSSMGSVVSAARELAEKANQAFASSLNISSFSGSLSSSTKTTSFASSALGVSSAGIINSTAKNQTSESRYSFNLVMPNGDTLAKYTFEPLKNYAASKGQPIVNPT